MNFYLTTSERAFGVLNHHMIKTLNLNLYKNHFSLIKDINSYTNCYSCLTCEGNFTRASTLKQHKCKPLNRQTSLSQTAVTELKRLSLTCLKTVLIFQSHLQTESSLIALRLTLRRIWIVKTYLKELRS